MFLLGGAVGLFSLLRRPQATQKREVLSSCVPYNVWASPANVEVRLYDDGKFRFFCNFPTERLIWVAALGCCSDSTADSIGSPWAELNSPDGNLSLRILDFRIMLLNKGRLAWSHRQGKTELLTGTSTINDPHVVLLKSPNKAYECRLYNDDLKITFAEAILWSAANSHSSSDSCQAIYKL